MEIKELLTEITQTEEAGRYCGKGAGSRHYQDGAGDNRRFPGGQLRIVQAV